MRSELAFLESLVLLTRATAIVEVGVAHGDSIVVLCRAAEKTGGHVVGFDLWARHGAKGQFRAFGSRKAVDSRLRKEGRTNYELIQLNTAKDKVQFIAKLDEAYPDGIDFAFIDGDHSYAGVKNDFDVIYPRIKPTGVIAFHDTMMIDGCREFMLDLREKYHDGTYDVVDLPFGGPNGRAGVSLLVKRAHHLFDITEVCGSPSSVEQIRSREAKWR